MVERLSGRTSRGRGKLRDEKPVGRLSEHGAESDARRSLQRIAARLLAVKELEEEALAEIDKIAAAIDDKVRWKFNLVGILFGVSSILTIASFLAWFAVTASGPDQGFRPLAVIAPLAAIMIGSLGYWRHFQYGFGRQQKARPAIRFEGSKATIDTLEKLFAYLAKWTSPRAYYRTRSGEKRYVNRHYFLGALRFLLLSEDAAARAMVMPPGGNWFFREIRIEADPEEVIAALKVKPRSGGRPQQYNHATIVLILLEHPAIRGIDPSRHGAESQVMALIRSLCEPSDEHHNDIAVPEDTELRKLAKRILAAIEKNRTQPKE